MEKLKFALIPPLKSIIKLGSNKNTFRPQPSGEMTQRVPSAAGGGCSRTNPCATSHAMGAAVWVLQPGWALRCCSNHFSPGITHPGGSGSTPGVPPGSAVPLCIVL